MYISLVKNTKKPLDFSQKALQKIGTLKFVGSKDHEIMKLQYCNTKDLFIDAFLKANE